MSSQIRKLFVALALLGSISMMGCRGECVSCIEDVTQPGPVATDGCRYRVIQPPQKIHSNLGGNGGFSVSTDPQTCEWTTAPQDNWIKITSGHSGTGNGEVKYDVAPNSLGGRTGSIPVKNKTGAVIGTVTVVQNPR